MNSYIVSSKDEQKGIEKALEICRDFKVNQFDISVTEQNDDEKKAIGIEQVRQIQKKVFLKPLKSTFKTIIIKNSQSLTVPAQNALLKILEEPPVTTLIILVTKNAELLLPTVISRCKVFEIDKTEIQLSEKEINENIKIIKSLINSGIGERLKLAADVSKSKEITIEWLKKMILSLRKEFVEQITHPLTPLSPASGINTLKSFQKTYTITNTTNVNPRFALENLLLNL